MAEETKETKSKAPGKSTEKGSFGKTLKWIKEVKIFNKKSVKFLILLVAVLLVTNPSLIPFLPTGIKNRLMGALVYIFGDVTQISRVIPLNWIVLFQLIVMSLVLAFLKEVFQAVLASIHSENKRVKTIVTILQSITKYLFAIIGIIWGMRIMGINTVAIFASLGIASLTIGFSAENLIADIVSGFFLLFDNQLNVGDIIEVEDFRGSVKRIDIRTTSIEDAGGNIKIINNSDMRNIVNRSEVMSKAVCDIAVPAGKNIEVVEAALARALKNLAARQDGILQDKPEYLGIQSIDGDCVTLRIVAQAEEKDVFTAQRIINREVKAELQKDNIWG